ncbi:MAG TPA: SUMF1/EgtB/PvdO family nonheme iron enzyme [Cytophagaceae bacterium]|nr:SUMF1/EgtB/PvdO family nonheme iron enzyme [Cytophagaceae bacterium]
MAFYKTILLATLTGSTLLSCQQEFRNSAPVAIAKTGQASLASCPSPDKEDLTSMVFIKGGLLEKTDEETQQKTKTKIRSFRIDKNLVTVGDYKKFTEATKYVTEAEKFGNSAVFDFEQKQWLLKDGANYLYPLGPDKGPAPLDHPVTQVSWNDAVAYAKWAGKRLPTALEWEWAASAGGTSHDVYSWGNSMKDGKNFKANFWQGSFPEKNTGEDGYLTTSPVGKFGLTSLGLSDMGGNVWQWTADDIAPTEDEARMDTEMRKVTKGGSFLCDPNVCHGFKVDGKSSSTAETGLMHTGFRCVKDVL